MKNALTWLLCFSFSSNYLISTIAAKDPVMTESRSASIVTEDVSSMKTNNSESPEGEKVIKEIGAYMISVLSNKKTPQKEKEDKFRRMLDDHFDLKAIGKFTLGRSLPAFTKAENEFKASHSGKESPMDRFFKDFEDLVVEMYGAQFANYTDQKLVVEKSKKGPNGSIFIYSKILDDVKPAIELVWKLFNINGKFVIVDVIVAKVSMSMSQRREFTEYFDACAKHESDPVECFLTKIQSQASKFDKQGQANANHHENARVK